MDRVQTSPERVAAVLYAAEDLRIESVPTPRPGPREVLVQIRAVGVCGSDIHYFEDGRIGEFVVREPMILGHECAGVVAALGPGATRHSIGERVCLEPGVPCRQCHECATGRYNLCKQIRFFATPPIDGALATFVTIHEDFAFALPDGLSDEAGALIEPLSVGLWANWKAGVTAGDSVLVTGAGPIGLMAIQAARALGAARILVTDINAARLEVARRLGASETLNVAEQDMSRTSLEATVLIECSGSAAALAEGVRALRPAGRAVIVGVQPTSMTPFPLGLAQSREIVITGTFRYANTYPAAINLAASGKVQLEALVTNRFRLEESEAALRCSHSDPTSIKSMIVIGI